MHLFVSRALELFTALLFVFLLSVLLFVAVVVLDGIRMLLVLFTVLLFVFSLFVLLIVAVGVVAVTGACMG